MHANSQEERQRIPLNLQRSLDLLTREKSAIGQGCGTGGKASGEDEPEASEDPTAQSQSPRLAWQAGTCPPPPSFSQCSCPARLCSWESWQQAPNICSNPSEPHTGVTTANRPMPRTKALCRRNGKNRNISLQPEEKKGKGEMPASHRERHMRKEETCVLRASRQVSRQCSCCPGCPSSSP